MNPLNIIRLLDYSFYHSIINSNSLKDNIVPGINSRNVWNQQRDYINATSKNIDNRYYSSHYRDTKNAIVQKDVLNYTGSLPYSSASLRPSILFLE